MYDLHDLQFELQHGRTVSTVSEYLSRLNELKHMAMPELVALKVVHATSQGAPSLRYVMLRGTLLSTCADCDHIGAEHPDYRIVAGGDYFIVDRGQLANLAMSLLHRRIWKNDAGNDDAGNDDAGNDDNDVLRQLYEHLQETMGAAESSSS
jgi:hypothetical protein